MATKKMYTIYDKVAMEAGPIMVFNNDEQAIRAYPLAFKNQEHAKYYDFMLCHIGEIDLELMTVSRVDIPKDITPIMHFPEVAE